MRCVLTAGAASALFLAPPLPAQTEDSAGTDTWQHALAADGLSYSDLAPGIQYASVTHAGKPRPLAYHVVKVDLNDRSVFLGAIRSEIAENGAMAADSLTNMVALPLNQREGCSIVAAINADYFSDRPRGMHVQKGDPLTFANRKSVFIVDPDGRPAISTMDMKVRLRFGETGEWFNVTSLNNCAPKKGMPDTINLPSGWHRFKLREGEAVLAALTDRTPERIGARIATRLSPDDTIGNSGDQLLLWSARREWISCMQTNQVVAVQIDTTPAAIEAVGGGPRLVRDGVPSLEFEKEGWTPVETAKLKGPNPRTASGVSRDGKTVFLVVVEGRKSISQGLDAADLAQLMINLGCWDAMNHDGGGSASLYTPAKFVINQNPPRPIKNGLAVFRRDGP